LTRTVLGSFDEAEDLVQETFLRAWRRRDSFDLLRVEDGAIAEITTFGSGGGPPLWSLACRAARSARSRMMHGTMARAVSPPATQMAVP
jgi:hypothetical protein